MVVLRKEKPLPLKFLCSDLFWVEECGVMSDSGLFHFMTDIKGSHAAVTVDRGSLTNFVSIEVVTKLQLVTCQKLSPYRLNTFDDSLSITHLACVPLTIYGHTVRVYCDVIPRALNSCHLLLGKKWCDEVQIVFSADHSDPHILWNNKQTWLAYTRLKQFQEVRRQNLCTPIILNDTSSAATICSRQCKNIKGDSLIVPHISGVKVDDTCDSTNVIISTPSVVSCDIQVAFEERELLNLKPAYSQEEDVPVPTTSEEIAIAFDTDLELQTATMPLCEYKNLLLDYGDLTYTRISKPRENLQILNLDHVVLSTHKEILATIPPTDVLYYIMLEEPLTMSCAMNKITEISFVNSSTYANCFRFYFIGDYSMNEHFLVDHICITYDKIAELHRAIFSHICYVPESFSFGTITNSQYMMYSSLVDVLQQTKAALLNCSNHTRFEHDYTHTLCLSQTELYFTYICKLSCILTTWINDQGHLFHGPTAWSLLCSKYQSSAVEAWYPTSFDLPRLNWVYHDSMKFDHRSCVRRLSLILNNKLLYICVSHFDHDSPGFSYICNYDCLFLRFLFFPYDNYMCYACKFSCFLSFEDNHTNSKHDTTCDIYTYFAYMLFFLFLPLSAFPKPRTAFLEEREDDEDISVDYGAYPCLNWKEILSQTDYYYKVKSFLVGHDALIYKNVILPKVLSPCINRLELMESMAQGDEGAQELDYNIIHGAREEREACARGKDEGKDAGKEGKPNRHPGRPRPGSMPAVFPSEPAPRPT